jgi:hypothetical protein
VYKAGRTPSANGRRKWSRPPIHPRFVISIDDRCDATFARIPGLPPFCQGGVIRNRRIVLLAILDPARGVIIIEAEKHTRQPLGSV